MDERIKYLEQSHALLIEMMEDFRCEYNPKLWRKVVVHLEPEYDKIGKEEDV